MGTAPFDMTGLLARPLGASPSCRVAKAERRVYAVHGVAGV